MNTLSTLALYGLPLLFIMAFCLYTKWQIVDEDDGSSYNISDKRWHEYGLRMRVAVMMMGVCWVFLPAPDWKHLPLMCALCATTFDVGINLARNSPPLYVADHGWDGKIGYGKWFIYGVSIILSLVLVIFK